MEEVWYHRQTRKKEEAGIHIQRSRNCISASRKRFFKASPGKASGAILKPKEKYILIEKLTKRYPVADLCIIAGVSRSGYYQWYGTQDVVDKDYEDFLIIEAIFLKGKRKYGWRTIRMHLETQGNIMNHKKIQRIMRKYSLIAQIRKRNPYKAIMKKTQEHRIASNVLNRQFVQPVPYRALCTDITYITFHHRFVYLSTIKDICSGEIVAWYLDRSLHKPLVENTLSQLEKMNLEHCLLHSDQGWHYTHPEHIQTLHDMDMIQSMSRKGCCIDNAPMESFFGHFKDEIEYDDCETFDDLKKRIDDYMHYYNHERKQWSRNKMTPIQYRDHMLSLK